MIIANSVHLKSLGFTPERSSCEYTKAWADGGYLPPSLQLFWEGYPYSLRNYPPSVNHDAFLSFCDDIAGGIVPALPCFQYSFTPKPTIHMATPPWARLEGLLALTGATPDCRDFVTAKYTRQAIILDFSNICSALHTLRWGASIESPSIAG